MFFKVASCSSSDDVTVASVEKNTLNPRTNASRAVVSQHKFVITPVTITSSTPISLSRSSKRVPLNALYVSFPTTVSPSRRPTSGMISASGVPSKMRSLSHHSASMFCDRTVGSWEWRVKMTGMEARRQRSMVVVIVKEPVTLKPQGVREWPFPGSYILTVIEGRMGPAMEEKWFCMSMTRRTEVSGFGSLNLVSNFLYEDFEVFETDMVGNSSLLKSR
ncbi:hypothetical protein ACET3Z_029896 [Daucus carota]